MVKSRRISTKTRYLILTSASLLSLFLSIALLEISLDLAGRAFRYTREQETVGVRYSGRKDKEVINILALGDSFTFGGFGLHSKSFPGILAKMLSKSPLNPSTVSNQGVCESTSKDLLSNLQSVTTFAKPDVVLLLTGAANLFDPFPFNDELKSTARQYESFIKKRHVYKLLRHIYFELEAKWFRSAESDDGFDAGRHTAALRAMLDTVSAPSREDWMRTLRETAKLPSAEGMLAQGLLAYFGGDEANALNVFRGIKQRMRAEGAGAEEKWFNALYAVPTRIPGMTPQSWHQWRLFLLRLGPSESSRFIVEGLVRSFQRDSSLDPRFAVAAIDDALKNDPLLYRNRRLSSARAVFSDLESWRANVGRWFEADLRAIISILKENQVEVVLQTYPISYEPINTVIRSMAKEYGLPLVDHFAVFAPLIARDFRKYISDDSHCTDLGHELMARNVHEVLKKTWLNDPLKVAALKGHLRNRYVFPRAK